MNALTSIRDLPAESLAKAFSQEEQNETKELQALNQLLDNTHRQLTVNRSNAAHAIDDLFGSLRDLRRTSSSQQWNQMVLIGQQHPLLKLVHQDPFTRRAFEKPRGYAGDAVMMDYIYGREENWSPPPASDLGKAIFNYTTGAPASAGVRERRCLVADLLDRVGDQNHDAQILAVAAGHLREAELSRTVRRKKFQRFMALDTDPESVEEIQKCYARYNVLPMLANARQMLTGRLEIGSFDLIYSTGLYDYLGDDTATRLTARLFAMLNKGGRVVIANFLPNIRDVGYMEMFMGWKLIYRTRAQMMELADRIPADQIQEIRIAAESNENIVALEITKR